MSADNQGNPYRQRFKGIENFLRRVAFNLGNTPSQTEVKIISCIPIDVTDLQQKIITLEKELIEARHANNYKGNVVMNTNINKNTPTRHSTPIVQTALGKPTPISSKSKNTLQCKCSQAKVPVTHHACNTKSSNHQNSSKWKKSSVCFMSPLTSDDKYKVTYIDSNHDERKVSVSRDKTSKVASKIVPKRLKRVLRKRLRQKTQLVYFAQTSNTPFNSYDITSESINKMAVSKKKNVINRTYLNNVIRKQYEPELIVDKLTDISQLSSPVCRDRNPNNSNHDSYKSILSHSYGKYENLDKCEPRRNQNFSKAMNNSLVIDPGPVSLYYQHSNPNNYNGYYDSDHYDIFPVKEKPVKLKKEEVIPKQFKRVNIESRPEKLRTKNDILQLLLNYNETAYKPCDYRHQPNKVFDNIENELTLLNAKRKRNLHNKGVEIIAGEPKICSVDYGDVYLKRNFVADREKKSIKRCPSLKNAECLTVNTNNTECQTVESKAVQLNIPIDNKAEVALNQIKSILQSVLAEVKTNLKSSNVVNKPKRDAVIQKDVSHNNIGGGSTLLNSFTYNPSYNVNPCLASYSRNIPNLCYANLPSLPMKCMQNYPLIIPPTKHKDCGCQHKDSIHEEKLLRVQTKQAITASTNTNTEQRTMPKNETVNLIREIYKSIALNVNYSNKNTSRISFEYQKGAEHPEVKSVDTEEITSTELQSTAQKDTELDATTTILTCNTINDTSESIAESTQSEIRSESERNAFRKQTQDTNNYLEDDNVYRTSEQLDNETHRQVSNNEDDDTDASSSETTSEDTLVANEPTEKIEKPGLFQKVLQSVNIFKKKKQKLRKGTIADDDEESDADYQTICSNKTYKDLKQPVTRIVQKPFTKLEHLQSIARTDRDLRKNLHENLRRSPYMEQEYRRYWDEKLMFHQNQSPMHSSERSFPGCTHSPQSPVFWRGYEARSACFRNRQSTIQREQSKLAQSVQRERTGLKLEWLKKHTLKTPVQEES